MHALIILAALFADPETMLLRAENELLKAKIAAMEAAALANDSPAVPESPTTPARFEPSPAVLSPQPPADVTPSSPGVQQLDDRPVVILETDPSWCAPCRQLEASITAYGEDRLPFKIERRKPSGGSVPRFYWDKWQHAGYEPIERFVKRWEYANSLSESAQSAAQAPTPMGEVARIVAALQPQRDETFVDYGCGDGRVLIEAVRAYGCYAVGVEIDPEKATEARRRVEEAGLAGKIDIITGDATKVTVHADVGFVYLYPELLRELTPKLTHLNRFASYMHAVPGLVMRQNGNAWIWDQSQPKVSEKDVQNLKEHGVAVLQSTDTTITRPHAVYQGQIFYGPCCNDPWCGMRQNIMQQLRARGYAGR